MVHKISIIVNTITNIEPATQPARINWEKNFNAFKICYMAEDFKCGFQQRFYNSII